jgi:uncharacterized repeat protein (TIGR01451 family)
MHIGDGTTPGTFTISGSYGALSMLGSVSDATRYIGNLAADQSKTVYWMLKYPLEPRTTIRTYSMTIWSSEVNGCFVLGSHTYTTQSTISASANKMLGTVTLDPADGQVHVGNILTVTVTGFNFGTIGQSGDAWLQPAGNLDFNPDQFRLIKTEVYIHSVANKCGYGSMPVYDRLYFPGIKSCYSSNTADYVKYYFVATSEGTTTAKIYQQAASGASGIEKYSGDYGTSGATVTFTAHCGGITIWKSVSPETATANTVLTWTITYRNDTDLPIGDPGSGNGLTVREDAIPANTTYVPGSATCSGSCIIYYSTDNGVTWTTTEPAPGQLTRIRWFINQAIPAHSIGAVSFQSKVNSGASGYPLICNSASAGVGDCPFAPTDTVCANGGADLDLIKVTSDHSPCEGAQIAYTVTVSNPSTVNATGIQVTDLLPPGLTYFGSSTSQGTYDTNTGLWNVGALNAYGSATLTLIATVNAGTGNTTIINWAYITAMDPPTDPVLTNNSDHDGITVHPVPIAYPASNSPISEGDTIYLFGGPGGMTSYHWVGPNGFSSDQENPEIPNATPAMAGTYTLTVTDSNGCGNASATTNVVFNPTADAGPDQSFCAGSSVQIGGSPTGSGETGPYTYNWTPTAGLDNPASAYPVASVAGTYTVRVTDANNCSDEDSVVVTENARPIADAGGDEFFCAGSSVEIGGSPTGSGGTGPYTYSWTPTAELNDSTIANPAASAAGTYTVRVTDANGCWKEDSMVVTQNPAPTANAGVDRTIACGAGSVQIGGSPTGSGGTGPYTYSWTPSAGLDDATIANPAASAAGTYTVRVTDAHECWDEDSVVVTVSGAPTAEAGPDLEICPGGGSVQIGGSPTGSGGTGTLSYSWTPTAGLDNPASANPTASPTSTTTYSVLVTDDNGCYAVDSVTVTVHDTPSCHISASPSASVCQGTTVTLTEDGGDAVSWSWSTGAHTQSTLVTGGGTYSVTITDSHGCQNTCQILVTVDDAPTADAGADKSICAGSSVQIGGSPTGSGGTGTLTYSWTPSAGLNDATIANPTASAGGTYTVRVTDFNGCWDEDSVVVAENANPTAYAGADKSFCPGSSVQIGGSPTGSGGTGTLTYSWTPTTGLSNPAIANPTASAGGTYTVRVTDANGCWTEDSVVVIERVATASSSSPASLGGSIYLAGGPDGMSSYSWTGPDGWTSTLQNPVRNGATMAMAGTYTLTVTAVNGCTDSVTVTVTYGCCICGRVYRAGTTEPLAGWQVILERQTNPWVQVGSAITDGNGKYCFCGLGSGYYRVSEAVQPGWNQVLPSSAVYLVTLPAGCCDPQSGPFLDFENKQGGPLAVGWEVSPIDKLAVLAPWIVLFSIIIAGASLLVLRRRRV